MTAIEVKNAGSGYSEQPDVLIEDPPQATMATYWSHDGSSQGGSEPATSLTLPVRKGIFSTVLGGEEMERLGADALGESPARLRVWFDHGNGSQQLSPDQVLASVPYALRAESVADGAIASAQIDSSIGLWTNNGAVFSTNRRVGIGTQTASQALEVDGNIEVSGWMGSAAEQPLDFRVANESVLRVAPRYFNDDFRPNVTVGAPSNLISGSTTRGATISGGRNNGISGNDATISGGVNNAADGSLSTIGGGTGNQSNATRSTVGGGSGNQADGSYSSIGGGRNNLTEGIYSTVGGGIDNRATGSRAVVGGGDENHAGGTRATVGGGLENAASGVASVVPGGIDNIADGTTSFAAGRRATAGHDGAFVWSDSSTNEFASSGNDQFLIRAGGGVGIGTDNPTGALHVMGNTAIGGFAHDHRLGIGTDNPWNTLHVVSNDDQSPFRVAVGSNNNTAFRVYPNRGAGIGNSWVDDAIPSRGLRVHGQTYLHGRLGVFTTNPLGGVHIKSSLVLEEPTWTDAWRIQSNAGQLRFYYRDDINSGSFDQMAYVKKSNGSWNTVSDERLKKDVVYLDNILPEILSLKPASYRMKRGGDDAIRDFGFIAQEVQPIFPEIISKMGNGYMGLDYSKFAVLSIQAIQEQQNLIETQADEIDELRKQIKSMKKLEERLSRVESLLEQ